MRTPETTGELTIPPEVAEEARRLANRHYPFIANAYDGGWAITFPDLPGALADAESFDEIGSAIQEALVQFIETQLVLGKEVPAPSIGVDFLVPTQADYERAAQGKSATDGSRLFSTAEAAEIFGVSRRRIQAIARSRNVGRKIGRDLMFTESELDELRPGPTGRHPEVYEFSDETNPYLSAELSALWGALVEAKNFNRLVTFWLRNCNGPVVAGIGTIDLQHSKDGPRRIAGMTVTLNDEWRTRVVIPRDVAKVVVDRVY